MPNFTIPVPDGTTNHGNPNLLCLPPQWTDYLLFYIGNYFAHAATIMLEPGNSTVLNLVRCILALALPLNGIARAVDVFLLRPGFTRDPLEKAARSRALCIVMDRKEVKRLEAEPLDKEINIDREVVRSLYVCIIN
jgi:hypothetical protein